jgi:hypothetical protein
VEVESVEEALSNSFAAATKEVFQTFEEIMAKNAKLCIEPRSGVLAFVNY